LLKSLKSILEYSIRIRNGFKVLQMYRGNASFLSESIICGLSDLR